MERSKKSQAPVSRMNNLVAWLRQNPLAIAVMGILFLLAMVGFLSPDRTPAMVLPVEQPVQSARDEGIAVAVPHSTADAAVKENHGSVNVASGHALVDTNYGTVNVGEVNILPEPKPQPVATVERVVERVVVVVPADAPAKTEQKQERQRVEQPSRVDRIAHYQLATSPECDRMLAQHQARISRWRASPGAMGR